MNPIDEKQWLIKRTEDYLKQVVEDFKNHHDEQEKYAKNKLKAISNVRSKLLAGITSIITILFGLSGTRCIR